MALKQIDDFHEWLKNCSLEDLCDKVIWESVMENTAHCGWTDRARDGLVKSVQESVKWAIEKKKQTAITNKGTAP